MTTKQIPAQKYFIYSTETTLPHVNTIAMREVEPLYVTATQLGLEAQGPLEFIYWNASGDPTKPFTLEIALPVNEAEVELPEKYTLTTHESFKAMAHVHHGDFSNIEAVYEVLFKELYGSGAKPTNQVREVYIHWVDLTSADNVSEILLGIE